MEGNPNDRVRIRGILQDLPEKENVSFRGLRVGRGEKVKVLVVFDVCGWAFEFVARGIQKYSKHEVTIKRWTDVAKEDKDNFDCLFCMNDSVWYAMGHEMQRYIKDMNNKCVGIRGEEMPCDRIISNGKWKIGAVNQKIYDGLLKGGIPRIYLTHNGVDTDIFRPVARPQDRFVVGWAGNPTQPLKRFDLLRQIRPEFKVKVMANWGRQFFNPDRSRDEMVTFYKSVDAFISVSEHEGMPQSILEAAATQLPIVVTDAGGMAEFVDREWVVPVEPVRLMLDEMNAKLRRLAENPALRLEVGKANLQKALISWSWSKVVSQYDTFFEGKTD
jgi:glycosyltransferase involved in cell wall biosynthesis